MAITFDELKARFWEATPCRYDDETQVIFIDLLMETGNGREIASVIRAEWLDEGRTLYLISDPIFSISGVLECGPPLAEAARLGLLTGTSVATIGVPVIDTDRNIRCAYTVLLEDNTLTSGQIYSILMGLIASIKSILQLGAPDRHVQ